MRQEPENGELLTINTIRPETERSRLQISSLDSRRALKQNAGAFITARRSYRSVDGTEFTAEISDTRYGVVFTGEKFPDGRRADAVYILLHDSYRDVLNSAPTRPLDYDYLKDL